MRIIKLKHITEFSLIFGLCVLSAQTPQDEWRFENSEETEKETEEILEELRVNRPDLNLISTEKLKCYKSLTGEEVLRIIALRDQHPFTDWSDLESRAGLDDELVHSMQNFFSINQTFLKQSPWTGHIRERIQYRFPESSGYRTGMYPGEAIKILHRMQMLYKNRAEAGLLIEKDPGEPDWNDHQTGYAALHFFGDHTHVIIGNYWIKTGFGLVLSGPYSTGKSAAPLAVLSRNDEWLHGHLYADENLYLTGPAIESRWRGLKGLLFFSNTARDARADNLISSFPATGLHRTDSERQAKKTVHEKLSGGRISVSLPLGTAGFTAWQNHYSLPVARKDPVRQKFGFSGSGNHMIGWDWQLNLRPVSWGGEWAQSSGGQAWISYLALKCRGLEWVLSFRNFSKSFHNPHASGFGYGDPSNEQGWYTGGQTRLAKGSVVRFYTDLSRSLWRTYWIPVPTSCSDLWIQADHRFSSIFSFSCQLRYRTGDSAAEGRTRYGISAEAVQECSRLQLAVLWTFTPGTDWKLRTRMKQITVDYPEVTGEIFVPRFHEQGFLLVQDIRFKSRTPFFWTAQVAIFDTDSYDSRVYIFENSLPGVLSNTALFGKGLRWNAVFGLDWRKWLQLTFRLGITVEEGAQSMGTGYDMISGDTVRDLGLQVDIYL